MEHYIIDAHIHPFITEKCSIARFGHPKSTAAFMEELRRCGIQKCCGSVISKTKTLEDMLEMNRDALRLRDMYPDFYIPGIHIHGDYPDESCKELETMYHEHGVRWIGELVAYSMKIGSYDSPGMFCIYETAQKLGMPVNIHCSDRDVIEKILINFPEMKLVIAHPEDIGNVEKRLDIVRRYKNAYLDISGTGLFRWGMLRYAVDQCGSEKILFGSDFPICSPGMNIGGVLAEHMTDAELKNIFAENFLRLISENCR